jgi:hypothetical protein
VPASGRAADGCRMSIVLGIVSQPSSLLPRPSQRLLLAVERPHPVRPVHALPGAAAGRRTVPDAAERDREPDRRVRRQLDALGHRAADDRDERHRRPVDPRR